MKRPKFKRASKIKVGANKDYTEKRSNLSQAFVFPRALTRSACQMKLYL